MTEPACRPLRKDAARNRDLLVQAARDVFAERGLEASMDDVAHRAGLGVGTAYRHFANKYDLAKAILAEAIERVYELIDEAAAMDDAWAGLVHFVEGAAEMQSADRGLREVLMGVHDAEEMERVNDRISGPLRDLVDRSKTAGAIRGDVEVTDIGIVVLMLCTVADITGDASPDLWRRYVPMLLDGLRSGVAPAIPPVPEDMLRKAMSTHKQRLVRLSQRG
jgi:AcrR family transcriptional regulator